MSRLPIRLRLTLPFAVGMAIVLAAVGFFIVRRVGDALLGSVDQSLRVQAEEVATHADRPQAPDRDRADAPQVAQILRAATGAATMDGRHSPTIAGLLRQIRDLADEALMTLQDERTEATAER